MFGAVALVCAARLAWTGIQIRYASQAWLYRLPDGAFTYLEIGRRMADGDGVTFDGIHRTNGFQPLWQLIVAGLAHKWDGTALIRAALLAQLLIVALAVALVARMVARRWGHLAAAGCLVVATAPSFTSPLLDGMAGALTLLAVVTMVALVARELRAPDDRYPGLLTGVGAGLVVWAQVDFLLPLFVSLAVLACAAPRRLRWGALSVASMASVTVPYFAWNLVCFGHVFSVSDTVRWHEMGTIVADQYGSRMSLGYLGLVWGQARSVWGQALSAANPLSGGSAGSVGTWLLAVPVVLGFVLLVLARKGHAARDRSATDLERVPRSVHVASWARRAPFEAAVAFGALLLLLHLALDLVLLPSWVTEESSLPARATFALGVAAALGCALGAASRRWVRPGRSATLLVMGALLILAGWPSVGEARHEQAKRGAWQTEAVVTAQWMGAQKGFSGGLNGGLIGSYTPGLLDFVLQDRAVVDLSGRANDFAYADLLAATPARGDMLERYRQSGVWTLVGPLAPDDPRRPACAAVIWEDPVSVIDGPGPEGVDDVPAVALDMGGSCGLNPEVIR